MPLFTNAGRALGVQQSLSHLQPGQSAIVLLHGLDGLYYMHLRAGSCTPISSRTLIYIFIDQR